MVQRVRGTALVGEEAEAGEAVAGAEAALEASLAPSSHPNPENKRGHISRKNTALWSMLRSHCGVAPSEGFGDRE